MTTIIGVWCLAAAAVIGWLLLRMNRHATRRLDTHIDTALAMANARDRHPATRAQHHPSSRPQPPRCCPACGRPWTFGPHREHICGGGA